jgi:hypothetical protein
MEPISGVEKVIGFIYRILFTIIPSGAFLCVAFLFLNLYSPATAGSVKSLFSGINAFWQVLLPLCLIFSLSLFIESLDLLLFYYMMDFGNLTNLRIFGEKNAPPLYDLKNSDFNELYNKTQSDTSIRRFVQTSHYSLGLIKSLMHHPRVFSHIYYQLGREFVFNNLTVVVLLISNCFAPYVIASFSGSHHYRAYQASQPILSVGYLILAYVFLKKYNAYKTVREKLEITGPKSYFKNFYKIPYFLFHLLAVLLFISCWAFPSAVRERDSLKLFAAFNCLLFPILLTMVFKGFKEYLNVEKYYLAYFVERHFVKSTKGTSS